MQLNALACVMLGMSPRLVGLLAHIPLAVHGRPLLLPVLQSSDVCPHPARLLPYAGGVLCVTYAVAVGTGISYFQYADIDSGRNIFIVGFTMFMALLVPRWLSVAPARLVTGSRDAPCGWQNLSPMTWQLPVPAARGSWSYGSFCPFPAAGLRHLRSGPVTPGWVPLDLLFLSLLVMPVFLTGFLSFFLENTVSGKGMLWVLQCGLTSPCSLDLAVECRGLVLPWPWLQALWRREGCLLTGCSGNLGSVLVSPGERRAKPALCMGSPPG